MRERGQREMDKVRDREGERETGKQERERENIFLHFLHNTLKL